jgi:ESCRT-II complex subunit VPS25
MPPKFAWPAIYSFPPFWTLQEVPETRRRQCDLWCDLILKYVAFEKKTELVVDEALRSPLFKNAQINRSLTEAEAREFLGQLVVRENARWTTKDEKTLQILFKKPEEWASLMLKWARANSFTGTVLTFYELREGPDTMDQAFHMLDLDIMKQAVQSLVKAKKAKFFERDALEDCGVKFE